MKKHTMFVVLALAMMFAYASANAQKPMGGGSGTSQQPGMQSPNNPNNPNNNPVDMGPTQQTQQQQQQMPQVSDSDLQNAVKTKLAADPAFANVQAAVEKGKVTLDGTVNSKDDKKKAKKTVQSIAGVRGVKEHLNVSGKESPGSQNNGNQKQMSNAGPGMAFLSSQDAAQGNASQNTAGSIAGNSSTSANPNSSAQQATTPEAGTMQQSGMTPASASGQLTLQKQIEMKIKNDRTLTDSTVNVAVSEKTVDLNGTVGSNQAKMHAQEIAQSYAQSRTVNNNLVVTGAGNSDLSNGHSAMSNGATQGTPKGESPQVPQSNSPGDQTTPH